jgi:hypothetical protein
VQLNYFSFFFISIEYCSLSIVLLHFVDQTKSHVNQNAVICTGSFALKFGYDICTCTNMVLPQHNTNLNEKGTVFVLRLMPRIIFGSKKKNGDDIAGLRRLSFFAFYIHTSNPRDVEANNPS